MALLKEIMNDKGVVCKYHKIEEVFLSENRLTVKIGSYTSQEYREKEKDAEATGYFNGKNVVEHLVHCFDTTIEEEESMGIRQLAYNKLKTLPEWEDAEDC